MGKRVGLLAGLLVLALGSGVVAQEPSPPPWFGGRVEMPEHGFAVILPDDWVAFDTGADVDGQVEAAQTRLTGLPESEFADLRMVVTDALAEGFQLFALEFSEQVIQGQVEAHSCIFTVLPDVARQLDEAFMDRLFLTVANNELVTDVERPTPVNLAAGPGWMLAAMSQNPYDADDWGPTVIYVAEGGDDAFSVVCTGPVRPDDDWLSIAETFEFLPEEE